MKKILLSVAFVASSLSAMAGGYLTNTNQNVLFLRNPAQDAQINLNSVYSNPAAVNFLGKGFHLGLNWQGAWQTREVTSTFAPFALGANNAGQATQYYEGTASAPVIPSVQAAWVRDNWNLHFNFALVGGGGKAEFDRGLGSFESQVALLGMLGKNLGLGFDQYDVNAYMRGKQYHFGFTLGTGYKVNDNLSFSLGLRGIYATSNYYGYLRDIKVNAGAGGSLVSAPAYFTASSKALAEKAAQAKAAAEAAASAGNAAAAAQYAAGATQAAAGARTMGILAVATQDVALNADQSGFGVAPILGLHYRLKNWDFAAKYEFATRLSFTNQSANSASADNLSALAAYKDGVKTRSDVPALLTLGVQYRPIEQLRLNAGYHHYFDKQAKQGAQGSYRNDALSGGTSEILFGAEYALDQQWELSAGLQRTLYPNTDAFMNDISFNVNSTSLGLGVGYRLNDRVKFNLAYFQTFYDTYKRETQDYNNVSKLVALAQGETRAQELVESGAVKGSDSFTRSNKVIGLGVEFKF